MCDMERIFYHIIVLVIKIKDAKPRSEFFYKNANGQSRIKVRDILYFQSHGRQITIHRIDGTDTFSRPLKEIERELSDSRFFLCHRSILVNYAHVQKLSHGELTLSNGERILISQGRRRHIREQFARYRDEDGRAF